MGSIHSLTEQLFNCTGDRDVLQEFEDAKEAWFNGDYSYSQAQDQFNKLAKRLKDVE